MKEKFEEIISNARTGADALKQTLAVKKALHTCEDELAVLVYDLGSEVYEAHVTGEEDKEAVDRLIQQITEKRAAMKSLHGELNALNGKVECSGCGKLTSVDFDFCPFCGKKLFDVVIEEDEEKAECCCESECCRKDECCDTEPCDEKSCDCECTCECDNKAEPECACNCDNETEPECTCDKAEEPECECAGESECGCDCKNDAE